MLMVVLLALVQCGTGSATQPSAEAVQAPDGDAGVPDGGPPGETSPRDGIAHGEWRAEPVGPEPLTTEEVLDTDLGPSAAEEVTGAEVVSDVEPARELSPDLPEIESDATEVRDAQGEVTDTGRESSPLDGGVELETTPTDAGIDTVEAVDAHPDTGSPCSNPSDCPAQACSVATCPAGSCSYASEADGTACDDGDPCTLDDVCHGGTCAGLSVTCTPSGPCLLATCDTISGQCVEVAQVPCCGNGEKELGEDCDPGPTAVVEGCSVSCRYEPFTVNHDDYNARFPTVAYNPDVQAFLVAWASENAGDYGCGVRAALFATNGVRYPFVASGANLEDFRIAMVNSSYTTVPKAVPRGQGFVVAWTDPDYREPYVVDLGLDANGSLCAIKSAFAIWYCSSLTWSGIEDAAGRVLDLAYAPSSDLLMLVHGQWGWMAATPEPDVAATLIGRDATGWFQVVSGPTTLTSDAQQLYPAVAASGDTFLVAWEEGARIKGRVVDALGVPGPELDLLPGLVPAILPTTAGFLVLAGDQEWSALPVDLVGSPLALPVAGGVAPEHGSVPSGAALPGTDGSYVVAWHRGAYPSPASNTVFLQRVDTQGPLGTVLPGPITPIPAGPGRGADVVVAPSYEGGPMLVVWQEHTDEIAHWRIRALFVAQP
jgi:cysteine-rich repeat protein